jgi:hypothetical protein
LQRLLERRFFFAVSAAQIRVVLGKIHGRLVFAHGNDGGQPTKTFDVHMDAVYFLGFSSDGRY